MLLNKNTVIVILLVIIIILLICNYYKLNLYEIVQSMIRTKENVTNTMDEMNEEKNRIFENITKTEDQYFNEALENI